MEIGFRNLNLLKPGSHLSMDFPLEFEFFLRPIPLSDEFNHVIEKLSLFMGVLNHDLHEGSVTTMVDPFCAKSNKTRFSYPKLFSTIFNLLVQVSELSLILLEVDPRSYI